MLAEGRCSLDVSFAAYKFLIMYGQLLSLSGILQYYFGVNMSQAFWIITDGTTAPLSWALTKALPAKKLAPTRPTARLIGVETISSIVGQILINIVFLCIVVVLLFQQAWFRCNEYDASKADLRRWWELGDNYESSITSLLVTFQILMTPAVFNLGSTYRRGFFRNWILLGMVAAFLSLIVYMTLADPNVVGCWFRVNCGTESALVAQGYTYASSIWMLPTQYYIPQGHNVIQKEFRYILVSLMFANFGMALAFHAFFILGPFRKWLRLKR